MRLRRFCGGVAIRNEAVVSAINSYLAHSQPYLAKSIKAIHPKDKLFLSHKITPPMEDRTAITLMREALSREFGENNPSKKNLSTLIFWAIRKAFASFRKNHLDPIIQKLVPMNMAHCEKVRDDHYVANPKANASRTHSKVITDLLMDAVLPAPSVNHPPSPTPSAQCHEHKGVPEDLPFVFGDNLVQHLELTDNHLEVLKPAFFLGREAENQQTLRHPCY